MIDVQPEQLTPRLKHKPLEKVVTLVLEGEICQTELGEIFEMLLRLAGRNSSQVVIDLTEVTHLDYRGVKPLILRAERFRKVGGDLKLCGLSPYVHAIFRSAGAHDTFEYYATPDEARAAFSSIGLR